MINRPPPTKVCFVCAKQYSYSVRNICGICNDFFEYMVQENIKSECKKSRNCSIAKSDDCSYCRFMLCIKAGMDPTSVKPPAVSIQESSDDVQILATKFDHEICKVCNESSKFKYKSVACDNCSLAFETITKTLDLPCFNTDTLRKCENLSNMDKCPMCRYKAFLARGMDPCRYPIYALDIDQNLAVKRLREFIKDKYYSPICQVCGSKDSIKNCSQAFVCDKCFDFFKKSTWNKSYEGFVCQNETNCEISGNGDEIKCQACHWSACLMTGLDPTSIPPKSPDFDEVISEFERQIEEYNQQQQQQQYNTTANDVAVVATTSTEISEFDKKLQNFINEFDGFA